MVEKKGIRWWALISISIIMVVWSLLMFTFQRLRFLSYPSANSVTQWIVPICFLIGGISLYIYYRR